MAYPYGNGVEVADYVSVYLHNCNEVSIYVHATLEFLEKNTRSDILFLLEWDLDVRELL